MIVAGLGFRRNAPASALAEALALAIAQSGGRRPEALASVPKKAADAAMTTLAAGLGLPVLAVDVAGCETPTQSPRVQGQFATGSLAEAAALRAAGPGARLLGARVASSCGRAVAALAEGAKE